MNDHRVNIKIEFEMHGHKAKHDMSVDWFEGLPESVASWINVQNIKAMETYDGENLEAQHRAARMETAERAQLARLQAKYE